MVIVLNIFSSCFLFCFLFFFREWKVNEGKLVGHKIDLVHNFENSRPNLGQTKRKKIIGKVLENPGIFIS